ncbi:MAG: permease [Bdellovibrionaceae bacterium]|nr:permease [Pseudobdellovibrionaceae bacterium]
MPKKWSGEKLKNDQPKLGTILDSITKRSLRLSLVDAFLYSLMVGLGETYLPAYVLSIGLGEIYAGLLSSLPLLSGAVIQMLAPRALGALGSTKRWIVLSTGLQACAYLPLVYFTVTRVPDFWTLFVILTLYWGAGFAASPAWNYWMGHLVPTQGSSQFFSRRSRILQTGILLGLILGGVALHNKVRIGPMTSVFTGLFGLAFLCRILSSIALSQKNFHSSWEQSRTWSIRESWIFFREKVPQNKFFVYLFVYITTVFVSSPFVAPYMLAQVKMDYGAYMGAIAALMLGKIVMLWFVEKLKGAREGFDLLRWGMIMVSPLPILWAFSTNYQYILMLQVASGMAWACLEVGLILIFFQDLERDEKIPFLTFYNLLNSLGILAGTGLGALWLYFGHATLQSYWGLFVVGGILRLLASRPLYIQIKKWQGSMNSPRVTERKAQL